MTVYAIPQWFGSVLFLAFAAALFACFATWAAGRDLRDEVAELRRRLDEVAPVPDPDPVPAVITVPRPVVSSTGGTEEFLARLQGDYRAGSDER